MPGKTYTQPPIGLGQLENIVIVPHDRVLQAVYVLPIASPVAMRDTHAIAMDSEPELAALCDAILRRAVIGANADQDTALDAGELAALDAEIAENRHARAALLTNEGA